MSYLIVFKPLPQHYPQDRYMSGISHGGTWNDNKRRALRFERFSRAQCYLTRLQRHFARSYDVTQFVIEKE